MQLQLLDKAGAPSQLGTVRLHCGDWRSAWWAWPDECTMISDPPYGIDYESNFAVAFDRSKPPDRAARGIARSVVGDKSTAERDAALAMPWTTAAVWGPRRLDLVPPWGTPREVLVHDKGGMGMGDLSMPWKPSWETISIYGKGWEGPRGDGVLRGSVVGFGAKSASNGRKHPNQKPLNVCAELVSKAPPGLPIVDPFAGSGQIPLAAALLGRDVYAAEVDPEHYANCRSLLEAHGITVLTFDPVVVGSTP